MRKRAGRSTNGRPAKSGNDQNLRWPATASSHCRFQLLGLMPLPSDPGRSVAWEFRMVSREEFRRAAFAGWERDQEKAEERPEARPAEFPAEQAAGQAQDWDYPVSARDCSDRDRSWALSEACFTSPRRQCVSNSTAPASMNSSFLLSTPGVDVGSLAAGCHLLPFPRRRIVQGDNHRAERWFPAFAVGLNASGVAKMDRRLHAAYYQGQGGTACALS